ncbi:MAG: hypothetical protein WCA11_00145 [Terracidiphilus sp.]
MASCVLTIAARSGRVVLTGWYTPRTLKVREIAVSTYPPPGPGASGVGRRIEEAVELIEMELRHTVAYVNDAVVPQVRKESITAMRRLSETLRNLADRMDQPKGPQT